MTGIFKRFSASFLLALIVGIMFFVSMASAQGLGLPSTENYDAAITGNVIQDKFSGQTGSTETRLESVFKGELVTAINSVIAALAIIWMGVLAVKFISSQGEEEKISGYKKQFGFIILGLFVVSIAEYAAFSLLDPTTNILDGDGQQQFSENLYSRVQIFVTYFQYLAGGIVIVIGGLAAFTMVTAGNQDEKRQAEVKFIKTFILGTITIVLAEVMVRVISLRDPVAVTSTGDAATYTPTQGVEIGVIQISGIIKFILSFFGGAAFLMIVLSALYFIISLGKEEQVGRAKRMLIYSIAGLLIATSAYGLVSYVVSNYTLG